MSEQAADTSTGSDDALSSDSVVLITGGARGIAARAAIAIAREHGCKLELVGRSPLPESAEDEVTAGAADQIAIRKALVAEGRLTEPAAIEAECRAVLAAREIRATLDALREAGSEVRYHAVDVRDEAAFGATIDEIYEARGRLDGVIHAAGVLEDKLIRDKTADSFQRVFDTKIAGARTLATKLRDDVGFVVFFGSIAGAFGNRGQVDYATANDAYGALARELDSRVAGRVVTIHWGPWQGTGMVTPALEKQYARRGIGLVGLDDGIDCLLREIRCGASGVPEVVVMRARPEVLASVTAAAESNGASTEDATDSEEARRPA